MPMLEAIELSIKIYADDSYVMCELIRNRAAEEAGRLESNIDRIVDYFDRWLKLNIDKCKVMRIGQKNQYHEQHERHG